MTEEEQDLLELKNQAHELGIHYTRNDPSELAKLIALTRRSRRDRGDNNKAVPCFGVSHDPTDRRCRICQLKEACAKEDGRPHVFVHEVKLKAIPCDDCDDGRLSVELLDMDTKELRDYGCTTPKCQNTLALQNGFSHQNFSKSGTKHTIERRVQVKAAEAVPDTEHDKAKKEVREKCSFRYEGKKYNSLSAVSREITGNVSLVGSTFFKVKARQLYIGQTLKRVYKGTGYVVDVVKK